jgi:hypothetical protein
VKKTRCGVACGNTHEPDERDGVAAGHGAAVLSAGSGAVERIRRLPAGDQRVAQILSRDAFHHDHGTGAEGSRVVLCSWLLGSDPTKRCSLTTGGFRQLRPSRGDLPRLRVARLALEGAALMDWTGTFGNGFPKADVLLKTLNETFDLEA